MFTKKRPSDILLDYIEGRGTGNEIDNYVHKRLSDMEEEKVVRPLMDINRKYSNDLYFIGISNPAAFEEIRSLAEDLKKQGM